MFAHTNVRISAIFSEMGEKSHDMNLMVSHERWKINHLMHAVGLLGYVLNKMQWNSFGY